MGDAKNGLLAAARISDQLEISQMTIATLKHECKLNYDLIGLWWLHFTVHFKQYSLDDYNKTILKNFRNRVKNKIEFKKENYSLKSK